MKEVYKAFGNEEFLSYQPLDNLFFHFVSYLTRYRSPPFSHSSFFYYCFPSLISVLLSLFLVLKLLLMITFCLQDHPMIRSLNSASLACPCQWYTRSTASPGTVGRAELRRMLHALHGAGGRNRHGLSSRVWSWKIYWRCRV